MSKHAKQLRSGQNAGYRLLSVERLWQAWRPFDIILSSVIFYSLMEILTMLIQLCLDHIQWCLAHWSHSTHVSSSEIEIVGGTVVIAVRVEDMQHHSSVSFSGRHSLGIIDDHRHMRSTSRKKLRNPKFCHNALSKKHIYSRKHL